MNVRLASLTLGTVVCAALAYVIFAAPSPTWAVAFAGILSLASVAGAVVLLAVAYTAVIEDLRPRFFCRAPEAPLALARSDAAMVGKVRIRNHPLRYWVGLTLNHRLFVGAMVFRDPETLSFDDPSRDRSAERRDAKQGSARKGESANSSKNPSISSQGS